MTRIPAQHTRRRDVVLRFALYPLGTFALMYTMGAPSPTISTRDSTNASSS